MDTDDDICLFVRLPFTTGLTCAVNPMPEMVASEVSCISICFPVEVNDPLPVPQYVPNTGLVDLKPALQSEYHMQYAILEGCHLYFPICCKNHTKTDPANMFVSTTQLYRLSFKNLNDQVAKDAYI